MCNCLEIFSGAGGLATGLGLAGGVHSAFVEWNHDACRTLRANYDESIIYEGDIRSYDFANCIGIDFVAGGPPCQPFSMGGKAKGCFDKRDMFPSAIKSVRELLPKAFFFENVKGLLRPGFKSYLDYILLQLRYPTISNNTDTATEHIYVIHQLAKTIPLYNQYNVTVHLVNAADYGVPQKRERVVIVGIRKDLDISWSLPMPSHSQDSLLWDKYVTKTYWERHNVTPSNAEYELFPKHEKELIHKYGLFPPGALPWQTVRDALVDIPSEGSKNHFASEHVVRNGAKEYPGHTGSPIDEPAKTIKAGGHGVPGGENMIKFEDGSCRYFTVFEAKRIQTFPDDYKIIGSWTEAMRQIGNAVPVKLAQTISSSIIEKLS